MSLSVSPKTKSTSSNVFVLTKTQKIFSSLHSPGGGKKPDNELESEFWLSLHQNSWQLISWECVFVCVCVCVCVCWQDEGGQLQSVWERGPDAAAEELQMRFTFDPGALSVPGKFKSTTRCSYRKEKTKDWTLINAVRAEVHFYYRSSHGRLMYITTVTSSSPLTLKLRSSIFCICRS